MGAPRVALLGLPFDHNSSLHRGAASAPEAIRRAFRSGEANPWSELGDRTDDDALLVDRGDVAGGADGWQERVEAHVAAIVERGERPLCLGGDHSVTVPAVRAVARAIPDLTIVHFDAHPDLYDVFEGNRESHACPFARIMEEGMVRRLVQVGIRTLTPHQQAQAARFGVEMVMAWELARFRSLACAAPIYLTFDLDALDPAFAPGVSHHEPGGISTREAIEMIHGLAGQVVGADIVELNPARDPIGMTAMVAAKLLKETVSVMARAPA